MSLNFFSLNRVRDFLMPINCNNLNKLLPEFIIYVFILHIMRNNGTTIIYYVVYAVTL